NAAKNRFLLLVETPLFEHALTKILETDLKYKDFEINEIKEKFKNIKVTFVQGARFSSMVAPDGMFLNTNIFRDISLQDKQKTASIVGLFLHEGFHYSFRQLSGDFGWRTPRGKTLENGKKYEGGFLFETLLFGGVFEYWEEPNCIL